jgi:hypothetical protein
MLKNLITFCKPNYITSFPNPHPCGHELQNITMKYKINNDELLKPYGKNKNKNEIMGM